MSGNKITISKAVFPDSSTVFRDYLEMFKIHLCLYIGFSAIFGQVMASHRFSLDSFLLGLSVFILACGSAVLNNIQDRKYDSFFVRTEDRSLPQKRVPLSHAKIIAALLISSGLSGLLLDKSLLPFFFGTAAVILYNGVYTPLKKKSLMAIIPGSIVGMMAPLIGWSAGGEDVTDPAILIILSVFGLWQIPHFFLMVLKTIPNNPYNNQLNRFPCFSKIFSKNEIILQTLIWTNLYTLAIFLFLINGSLQNQIISVICGLNAAGITLLIPTMMYKRRRESDSFAFAAINLSIFLFMGTGIWDQFVL